MQIIKSLDGLNITEKTSVALGNFDGLHVGHREIMRNALDTAKEKGLRSLCFTFSNHPFNFILRRDDSDPDAVKLICTEDEKVALTEAMGFDILVNVPFDEHIMKMRAHDFFTDIIRDKFNAGHVSVGFNYTYGARAEGKPALLCEECSREGISVSIRDAVTVDGHIVSSTLIREMISTGNMEMTARFLGRPYSFSGTVSHGKRLGTKMGIPTINIPAPDRQMLPPNGVYFSRIDIAGKTYDSVSNLGVNPTVNTDSRVKTIETNIFDYDDDAYGQDVTVYFDHFSRGERKFRSKEELFEQIARDCENALDYRKKR
ncbi:MAG: bifunctional riboflavin kinase/FAD synthetase [Clostridiales bacterium]|nr:bifunctional riboflavin kinase/FAD synthetase [Clostridiales bacterium]